jgi:hypothetical protein
LSQAEYEKIKNSFDEGLWKSWAGIYQSIEDERRPNFVLVVKLPDKAKIGTRGAAGLGAGLAGTAGILGMVGTHWKAAQQADELQRAQRVQDAKIQNDFDRDIKNVQDKVEAEKKTNSELQRLLASQILELGKMKTLALDTQLRYDNLNEEKIGLEKKVEELQWWKSLLFDTVVAKTHRSLEFWDQEQRTIDEEIAKKGKQLYNLDDEEMFNLKIDAGIVAEYFQDLYEKGLKFEGDGTPQKWASFFKAYMMAVMKTTPRRDGDPKPSLDDLRRLSSTHLKSPDIKQWDMANQEYRDTLFKFLTKQYFKNKLAYS